MIIKATNTENLLHIPPCIIHILSLPHFIHTAIFYWLKKWGLEWLTNLSRATELGSGSTGIHKEYIYSLYIGWLSHCWTQIPAMHNLKEETVYLAYVVPVVPVHGRLPYSKEETLWQKDVVE